MARSMTPSPPVSFATLAWPSTVMALGVALGLGLLIGIERERRKGSGRNRAAAGVRTFSMAALCGAVAQLLGQPALVAVGALLVLCLVALGYWQERRSERADADPDGHATDPGITTELALFATYLLGVLAVIQPQLAAALAVVVAGLLAARTRLHRFSTQVLTANELHDLLLLAAAVLIVLPLLPDGPIRLLAGLNPRDLWRLAVLLMALQAVGHAAQRLAGTRLGLALAGLAAGFVSSTATHAAMGARSRRQPGQTAGCVAGALFSNVATVVQLALVVWTVAPSLLASAGPMLLAAGGGALASGLLAWQAAGRAGQPAPSDPAAGDPHAFSARQALGFAALLSVVTAMVSALSRSAGGPAASWAVGLAGFVDVHAATAGAYTLATGSRWSADEAAFAMLAALSANSGSKAVAAWVGGGARYALRTGPGLLAMLAAGWTAWWLT